MSRRYDDPTRRQAIAGLAAMSALVALDNKGAHADPSARPRAVTDTLLARELSGIAGKVPALAALALNRQGVLGEAATGRRRMESAVPVSLNDRWHIGSCTKAMTAALFARFVEAGKLGFETKLADLLPGLKPTMHADWQSRTAVDVMSHSAGLDDSAMNLGWLLGARNSKEPVREQRLTLVRKALARPPRKPGTFAYANMNYVLIGCVLEQMAGEPWEVLLRREVFTPLGMTGAGFGPPKDDAPWGHSRGLLGRLSSVEPDAWADNPAAMGPAGTVHLPLRDWARFVAPFLSPGSDVPGYLRSSSLQRLLTPVARAGAMGADSALGWLIATRDWARVRGGPGTVFNHGGSNTMWLATVWGSPEAGFATLQASNCGPDLAAEPVDAAAGVMIGKFLKT